MKNILFSLFLLLSLNLYSAPSDHVNDEPNLLNFAFEKRMNAYLSDFYDYSGIYISISYLESLRGKDLDSLSLDLLAGIEQEKAIVMVLSLSDRQFTIQATQNILEQLDTARLSYLSDSIISYIKRREYDRAVLFFSQQVIFNLKDDFNKVAPPPTYKKYLNARGLIYFAILLILILLFGRSIHKARLLYTSARVAKSNKERRIQGAW
jgi:uncharacterized membrane protein YgcG